ncbi:MAG: peptidogalycan biosysnthesis protein, partial [Pseudomonadota bacterium]
MPPDDGRAPSETIAVEVVERLADIDADDWNALSGGPFPFLRHEFLNAAETTGCVSPDAGWSPVHLVLRKPDGRMRAAMPLYQKTHSWGEFVFDWAWANAYERAGLSYYPKLVSAAPFTPAPSPRLLLADPHDDAAALALAHGAVHLAGELGYSSLHVQFPLPGETSILEAAGL